MYEMLLLLPSLILAGLLILEKLTAEKKLNLMTQHLSDQLGETVRLLASRDALTYSELSFAKQREAQITQYEAAARYYTGDQLAAEDARISGELSEDMRIDEEDLNAINSIF